MQIENNRILLSGPDTWLTETAGDAYYVESGEINVFIVPLEDGKPGRHVFYALIPQGKVIPAFSWQDADYRQWRFELSAVDSAALELRPGGATKPLYKNFARNTGLEGFEEEGFQGALVEFYIRQKVRDEAFLQHGKNDEPEIQAKQYGVLRDSFQTAAPDVEGFDALYRAVAYGCKALKQTMPAEDSLTLGESTDPLAAIADASSLICRSVVLEAGWYKKDFGIVVGDLNGKTVTCVPVRSGKYRIYYPEDNHTEVLKPEVGEQIQPTAHVLEPTLPNKPLTKRDLAAFARRTMYGSDFFFICLLGLAGALIGILLPTLNQKIYDDYIPLGNCSQLVQICVVIATFMVGNTFFSVVKSLSEFRLKSHVGYAFQDAIYYRVFHLPESFFRGFESADFAQRIMGAGGLLQEIVNTVVITGISQIFSLVYLVKMYRYSSKLTWIALLMVVAYAGITVMINLRSVKYEKLIAEANGEQSSRLYQYLNGIEKIRMAGAEELAIYQYLKPFAKEQSAAIRRSRPASFGAALGGVASTLFSMVFYLIIVKKDINISMGQFIAFNSAMGTFTGAALQLTDKLIGLMQLKPSVERLKPVLESTMEDSDGCENPGQLNGAVGLNKVTFSYGPGTPNVLDGLSLDIKPGEYVGIVGPSGCGKSTLLKLLLGFEKPVSGTVTYDGKDLASLNKYAVRQNLGVVLQNGRLISGSIYENITITAPKASMADVNEVIQAVGLKNDIDGMPMGIHTVLSENAGTISGGQQQRILIARAIIRKPSILIFDEATSALDNVTQAMVTESLDKMHITRIVVAHRLSTIQACDRIIVLNNGRIQEQGTFEELMKNKGLFYELASRQIA